MQYWQFFLMAADFIHEIEWSEAWMGEIEFHHSQDYPTTRGMTNARENNGKYVLTTYLDSEGEREGIAI